MARTWAAVRAAPVEVDPHAFVVAHTPGEDDPVDAEASQQLWQLRWQAEGVRKVAEPQRLAEEASAELLAELEIAHRRFAAGDEEIRQDEPWTDQESSARHQGADLRGALGAHVQVVEQQRCVAVEGEAAKARIAREEVEQVVEHVDQTDPCLFGGPVPGAVPVSVGGDVRDDSRHPRQA